MTLQAAREAFAAHQWDRAFELLGAADGAEPLGAEDLERLAEAARWSRRFPEMLDTLERAQHAFARAGERCGAARVAVHLAIEHDNRCEEMLAAAWLSRARRLLADLDPCPEQGLLLWTSARARLMRGEVAEARALDEQVVALGRSIEHRSVEALGLLDLGHALMLEGDHAGGAASIDEASAAALSGELDLWTTGTVFCSTIVASRNRGDWVSAGQWTEASLRWCRRASVSGFPGLCRFHRAEVMRLRGDYDRAERDALDAAEELLAAAPRYAAWAYQELGEIRRRRDDLDGAREAFRRAAELGFDPQPGLALLHLDQGRALSARQAIRGALADEGAFVRESRPLLLPAAVTIALAAADDGLAATALAELGDLAEALGTPAVHASALVARGEIALARGHASDAVDDLRAGWHGWRDVDAPFEAARARMLLGQALRAIGEEDAAEVELVAARDALRRLGAAREERRATTLLSESAGTTRVVRTLVFTDIVDSTRLVEALGDAAWEDMLAWHDRALRGCFAAHHGQEVKHAGDGFFVAFADPAAAIECAREVQRSLERHRRDAGFAPRVRIGVHTTETTMRGDDYSGRGVHEAARVAAAARDGEILVTRAALEAAGVPAPESLRTLELKGLAAPMEVTDLAT